MLTALRRDEATLEARYRACPDQENRLRLRGVRREIAELAGDDGAQSSKLVAQLSLGVGRNAPGAELAIALADAATAQREAARRSFESFCVFCVDPLNCTCGG